MESEQYTHTVVCFTEDNKRYDCASHQQAIDKANALLRLGHRCKIYPYRPPRRYVDFVAENEDLYR